MILSSPFSRQNRSHQTWTSGSSTSHNGFNSKLNGSLQRKPAPEQPAPEQPEGFKSHTLNRLDQLRRRRQQQPANGLRRNLSSLGHYPEDKSRRSGASGHQPQIYAPASIASPGELARYKPTTAMDESQHYAATSFRGPATPSESGRSGRDSALGQLWERFGTLRRRAKWSKSARSKQQQLVEPAPAHLQPTTLDPEIYATGKRQVEAEEIYAEGSRAIDGNSQKRLLQHELSVEMMHEGETKTLIEEQSKRQPEFVALVEVLRNWINDELAQQRIIVRDLQDDLYDGQILGKLIEKLHKIQLDLIEVTQNETAQRHKLRTVLETINRLLALQARWAPIKWTVDGIHGKNLVEIIHLLVTLALYYRAPIKLPAQCSVMVFVVQKHQGQLVRRSHQVQLTGPSTISGDLLRRQSPNKVSDGHAIKAMNNGDSKLTTRDAFDALIEDAPEKLAIVKRSLVSFVNRHLNKINMSCFNSHHQVNNTLDPEQFSDGLLLVFLISSLEDYFVPLGNLFTVAEPDIDANNNNNYSSMNHTETALEMTSYINTQPIHKLHNVNVAMQLIEEAGISIRQQVRAEDLVNGDLKSVLRVLYALFSRYRHL